MNATQLAASSVNLENSIVFSAGCHSGYNIVGGDAVPGRDPDARLGRGVRPEAGDADRRHRLPVRRHRLPRLQRAALRRLLPRAAAGSGPVSVGSALVAGRADTYLDATPNLQGIDIKSLLEATLYGLPMLSVNLPDGRIPHARQLVDRQLDDAVATDPGAALGLSSADLTLTPTPDDAHGPAREPDRRRRTDRHLPAAAPTASTRARPPRRCRSRSATSARCRRRSCAASASSAAPTATSRASRRSRAPRHRAQRRPLDVRLERVLPLAAVVGQLFRRADGASSEPDRRAADAHTGAVQVRRAQLADRRPAQFSSVNLRLFYSANTQTYGANTPALAAPPTIARVDASANTQPER